ncbi:unnamed protein product [Mycena citricolor]|uniref:Nucleolar complex-associated protein 3 n=1 Tax=Mycena citricolor TaxID=2018698 RepID=A0AAD2JVT0_9AGAR|nr:unnamed protein product [Mycena citricolor]
MAAGKRSAPVTGGPSKKRKLGPAKQPSKQVGPPKKYNVKPKDKNKQKAADRGMILVPANASDDEAYLSDQDVELLEEYGGALSFLDGLDQKAISRSKKETERLRQLQKPIRKAPEVDDLPSLDSDGDEDENEDDWSSGMVSEEDGGSSGFSESGMDSALDSDSDAEMPYEIAPRKHRPSWDSAKDTAIERLPIKLANGRVQKSGVKLKQLSTSEDSSEESEEEDERVEEPAREDVATGARFGRPAVVDILSNQSRSHRIQGAKEQIASICQDIMADPEGSLGLLRRLHTFSLAQVSTPTHPDPVPNDPVIRKLAILSQLAVFKDIIPGYRIRALSDKEKAEKVSQMVARTREWEQGLVVVYQNYLRALEAELKAKSELADIALGAMCTLLTELIHFNFRVNLMNCIVARLSRKSWDKMSQNCLDTLVKTFKSDVTGTASLEIVRVINRMVKEKRFNVNPNVLTCLMHLRLKTELGVRSSDSHADKPDQPKRSSASKDAARRSKGKATSQPHLSKAARKVAKEKREIDREFREAEAQVDKEERSATHTETLKLLFVLYFKIIKHDRPTALLPAALQGIARYSHLVNIDFFRDLLKVLKDLVVREIESEEDDEPDMTRDVRLRLQCIVTAFELLSGQGEALNIDLIVPRVGAVVCAEISWKCSTTLAGRSICKTAAYSIVTLVPKAALRSIKFVAGLIGRDGKIAAMLSTEERALDGSYRPEVDDPQLCNPFGTCFWELAALSSQHWDPDVRSEAAKVLSSSRA